MWSTCDRLGILRFASELGGGGGITVEALRRADLVALGAEVTSGQPAGAIHFSEEPWREPLIATFKDSGTVHAVRAHALTRMGDMLFMLHVPWIEQ